MRGRRPTPARSSRSSRYRDDKQGRKGGPASLHNRPLYGCYCRRPAGKRLNSSMPHQTEPSANNAIGSLLQGMLSRRQVLSENTQTIAGHPGLRPDILITAAG